MKDKLICPCCKVTGDLGPNFTRESFEGHNGSWHNFVSCDRCGVVFKIVDGWNNYN